MQHNGCAAQLSSPKEPKTGAPDRLFPPTVSGAPSLINPTSRIIMALQRFGLLFGGWSKHETCCQPGENTLFETVFCEGRAAPCSGGRALLRS